jgi:hypothetical protein
MFDKMHLRAREKLDINAFIDMGAKQCVGDGQYKSIWRLDMGNAKALTVRTLPYYQSANESIELNPSKFDHWSEVESVLSMFTKMESIEIDRLDHAVDLAIPYVKIREMLRIKRKQREYTYKTVDSRRGVIKEGMKCGEKPEVFCIYDKAYEVTSKYRFKPISGVNLGLSTRVEVRQFNKRILFPKLSQIKSYIDYDPFEKLESYELNEDHSDKLKLDVIRKELGSISFNEYFALKNSMGNFFRTYSGCFKRTDLIDQIREDYQSNLRKFIF